jgi:hypothetical protein
MKGYMEEMLYFVAIFFAILLLFAFLTYQRGTKGAEVRKVVEERLLNEEIASLISDIFNNKLPVAEKSYTQTLIDGILEGEEYNYVYYGKEIGTINITEIIEPMVDKYIKERWIIEVTISPDKKQIYGKLKDGKVLYVYEIPIPVPDEKVGKLKILIGVK